MVTKSANISRVITEKAVATAIGVLGSIITAILIWIGSSVQQMQVDVGKVITKMDNQVEINTDVKSTLAIHGIRLDTLTNRVTKIESYR